MNPDIRIFKNLDDLSRAAAQILVDEASQSMESRGRFLVALNGGGTPVRLFQLLAGEFSDQVDWLKMHVFWGDERAVPPDDPGSSYRQASELLLSHVPLPESNIHRVRGELGPEHAAQDYVLTLQQYASRPLRWPAFDLVFLGMGEDGHTASLFPGSAIHMPGPVLPVTAKYQDRPANRVTLTPRVLNSARLLVFMAAGASKAKTLAEVLSDRYNPAQYPAQRIQPRHGRLIWLVDEAAAVELPTGRTKAGN